MQIDPTLRSIHDRLTVALREVADKAASFANDIGDAEGGAHRDNAVSNRLASLSTALAANMQVTIQKAQFDHQMALAASGIDLGQLQADHAKAQAAYEASQRQQPPHGRG